MNSPEDLLYIVFRSILRRWEFYRSGFGYGGHSNNVHDHLIRIRCTIYERFCRNEIAGEQLFDIVKSLFPRNKLSEHRPINWYDVCIGWASVIRLNLEDPLRFEIEKIHESDHKEITCVQTCGSNIVFGTTLEGTVHILDGKTKETLLKYYGIGVYGLNVLDCYEFGQHQPERGTRFTFDFNKVCHCFKRGFNENDGDVYLNMRTDQIIIENNLGRSAKVHYSDWMTDRFLSRSAEMKSLKIPCEYEYDFNFLPENEIYMCLMDNGEADFHCDELMRNGICLPVSVKWIFLHISVKIGITAGDVLQGVIITVNDGSNDFDNDTDILVLPDEMHSVTAACLFANILLIGNDKGALYIYKFVSYTDLFQINYSQYINMIDISTEPISDIAVQIDMDDRNLIYIIVSTNKSIFKIKLNINN